MCLTFHKNKHTLGQRLQTSVQESTEVQCCLTNGPAGSEVVARGTHTDRVRGPREGSMQHLCPQVGGRSTWNREKRKRQGSRWHTHESVHNGPQVRVSNDEHQLQQRHWFRTETPTVTPCTHHCLLNKEDKYLLVRTLGWSDELDGTVGQLGSLPSPHMMAVTSTAPCYD